VIESGRPHRIVRIPESQIAQIFVQITDDLLIELDVPIRSDDPSLTEYRHASDAPRPEKTR